MTYDDVETFFHEFGHLMHHILGGQQQWAGISGITMESDFAEAPSQMLEEWIRSPQVLAKFARHYKTGEPIPAELVTRMNRASAFGRAAWVCRQNDYTAISYNMYKAKPDGGPGCHHHQCRTAIHDIHADCPPLTCGPRLGTSAGIHPPTTLISGTK
jgi:Zn-dependent oligopeptidase